MLSRSVTIIVSDLETHRSLPRLLQSISRQSAGLDRMDIIVAGNGGHAPSAPSTWTAITGIDNVRLEIVDESATPAQARNQAAATATGDLLLFLRPDYRLDPKYLTTAFSVFADHPETDVMFTDYIRLAPKSGPSGQPGMVQLPNFSEEMLQTHNILGPAVIMTRSAWESTQGFRDNTMYRDWDFWIQVAQAGNNFYHVNYPLASCEHHKVSFRERAEDGRYKAMIVINNQGFFHMHTVKWALSYLRGNSWAEAYNFMAIPGPMDVTRMQHDHTMRAMGADVMAKQAIRQFDETPTKTGVTV